MAIMAPDLISINRRATNGQAGRLRGNMLKRGQSGRSAVAAAAYAAGVRLKDERQGRVHDFRAKGGVYYSCIVGAGGWTGSTDREKLWNMAEAAEVKCNATTAREWMIPLPHELTNDQRAVLLRNICSDLAGRFGVIVDGSLHMPNADGDQRNYHAHVLMTTRRVNADGTLGGKTRELDVKFTSSAAVTESRKMMADRMNEALEKAGSPSRVSHETWEAQGIKKPKQVHEGVKATNARRKNSRIEAQRRGEKTRHQQNLEAGAIAAATEAERLRVIRDKIKANEAELAKLLANKVKFPPKVRRIKVPSMGGGKRPMSVENFMARVMAILAEILGNMFTLPQQIEIAAQVMETTAMDMQAARAIRGQQRNLRRQESRLMAKMMKGGDSQGDKGQGAKSTRLRRRRIYDIPDAIAAKLARENGQRKRPQQVPPAAYAARTRPQKARFDYMRAAKNRPPTQPPPKSPK